MDPTAFDFLVKVRFKYVEVKYHMYWLYSINTSYEDHIRWTRFHHGTITGAGITYKKIPWLWRARLAKNKQKKRNISRYQTTNLLKTWFSFFFSIRVFFTDTDDSQDSRGREGTIFYFHSTTSTRSLTLRHLQLCMWDDYHEFLIATLAFTRPLLNEVYHLI